MLPVQVFLMNLTKKNMTTEEALIELKNRYAINYKIYEKEQCVILSYSQIDSPKKDLIVRDCRGLILSSDFKKIYCKPFTRFFNYEENIESHKYFDFSQADVLEKVDGSLLSFYYHPILKRWCFSTRSMAFAEGQINGTDIKFADLVRTCFDKNLTSNDLDKFFTDNFKHPEYKLFTYSFELVSPLNKVVKSYDKPALYFLAIHSNINGDYIKNSLNIFKDLTEKNDLFKNVRYPEKYSLSNYKEILNFISTLNPTDEGFVCYDNYHDIRVKIKNPKYLLIASKRMNGVITKERILDIMRSNETDEYLSYFPEDKERFQRVLDAIEFFKTNVQNYYESVKDINDRKELAAQIKDYEHKAFIFKLVDKYSINDILNSMSSKKIAEIIDHEEQ